jgi:cytochrome d ubiquinol oxidase subunit I
MGRMSNLGLTRALFGTSLAFHIVFATLGVGFPLLIALAEVLAVRRRDAVYRVMARRWAAAFSVFLGVSVMTGTIVALQIQLLWPAFARLAGQIIALPFAIEVFAFFIEAVFTAIYVYAGDRIGPRARVLSASLVALGAAASALLITDVNAFMNTPTGYRLQAGRLVDVDPWRAMRNPAMPTELSHVLVSAYLAAALVLAAFAAWGWLRGGSAAELAYRRRQLGLTMGVAAATSLLTAFTGDLSGKFLAAVQPIKLAAAEGLFHTATHAPLTIGGVPDAAAGTVRGGIRVPGLLSWLATGSTAGRVRGLNDFPRDLWPPLAAHALFDLMVAIGVLAVVASALWVAWERRSRRDGSPPPRWLLLLLVAMGPLAMVGIEAGWVFAELGRQPWTVTGVLTTAQAATTSPYAGRLFAPFVALYAVLAAGAVRAIATHRREHPLGADLRAAEAPRATATLPEASLP